MVSKPEIQTILKEKYGINKNISAALSLQESYRLLQLLQDQPSVLHLTESFIAKNTELARNNQNYGMQRSLAEKKRERAFREIQKLRSENQQLEVEIEQLQQGNGGLDEYKRQLEEQKIALQQEVTELLEGNQHLIATVGDLSSKNQELLTANKELKKDNKELKNIVDQIRLRLAQDTKVLLQYEDSEIRKAVIRLFRWTLG